MIYIKENNNVLEKYEIIYSSEKLKELQNKIIKNCSEISKVETECKESEIPKYDYYRRDNKRNRIRHHFEDVKYKKSGNKAVEWDHYDSYEVDLYNCEYTMYKLPYIYDFIDDIMAGKEEAITILFNQDINGIKHFPLVEEKIKMLESDLFEFESNYISKRKEKLDELNEKYKKMNEETEFLSEKYRELHKMINTFAIEISTMDDKIKTDKSILDRKIEELLKIRDLNKNQEPITKYFYELVSLVEFKLVDTISFDEINRINEFFSGEVIEISKKLVLR